MMNEKIQTRTEAFKALFPKAPSYRIKQIEQAWFDEKVAGWEQVSTLSKDERAGVSNIPWMSVEEVDVLESEAGDAVKALLRLADGSEIETVLMRNARKAWTVCVSSQVGCAMRCAFCATGRLGLKRSLTSDEIVDQYRFWLDQGYKVSNIVYMGMGEPLANYENVRTSLNQILDNTKLGPTNITVSTVGILPRLDQIIDDPFWPHVRMAISLHFADETLRREYMPSTAPDFLNKLADWSHRCAEVRGRRHHITYEYILLDEINDSPADAKKLVRFITKTGSSKVNVIPFNCVPGTPISASRKEKIIAFKKVLRAAEIDVTERRSLGTDIAAACGQLAAKHTE